ncbi:MAG TPA: CsbD family protein, partial [Cyanobacteria bacterium UBA11367]|nr:CsbD family protein [Cyanobacteria bacterium UBA11367]
MSLQDRAKAIAKNIEGKVQEAVGEITGDPQQKA